MEKVENNQVPMFMKLKFLYLWLSRLNEVLFVPSNSWLEFQLVLVVLYCYLKTETKIDAMWVFMYY